MKCCHIHCSYMRLIVPKLQRIMNLTLFLKKRKQTQTNPLNFIALHMFFVYTKFIIIESIYKIIVKMFQKFKFEIRRTQKETTFGQL